MSQGAPYTGEFIGLETTKVQTLTLQPGDIIVINLLERAKQDDIQYIQDRVKTLFPNHQVAILDSGATIGIIRPAAVDL